MKQKKLTVIDFFCGAGGFSEGFRQQEFKVVMGIDNWRPAIETHNLNHHLNDVPRDVLEFQSLDEINRLPDSDIIIGSPPCVLFSMSNHAGKADKTLGIRLIETYLRVLAVKKHQPGSVLKAWFLENVPNSRKSLKPKYTFQDLDLAEWAIGINLKPDDTALEIEKNGKLLNTADYGAPQKRERFVCGEIIHTGTFPELTKTHSPQGDHGLPYIPIGKILGAMPRPNLKRATGEYQDPNYPGLRIPAAEMTDHFYDSGIYQIQWKAARDAKLDHPFMGKMSFPEQIKNPSRTIMATKACSTRESHIYKSEYKRSGDGEYRSPTVRELASLMGFPYVYQFVGKETTKWGQVGNAVCLPMSAAIARAVRKELGMKPIRNSGVSFKELFGNAAKIENLNTFREKVFDKIPQRKLQAKFRKHPFKDGNMTVELMNFNPKSRGKKRYGQSWHSAVFRGTGKGFTIEVLPEGKYHELERMLVERYKDKGQSFVQSIELGFGYAFGKKADLQSAYVRDSSDMHPSKIVEDIAALIDRHDPRDLFSSDNVRIAGTNIIPARQLMAMYAINRILSAN